MYMRIYTCCYVQYSILSFHSHSLVADLCFSYQFVRYSQAWLTANMAKGEELISQDSEAILVSQKIIPISFCCEICVVNISILNDMY